MAAPFEPQTYVSLSRRAIAEGVGTAFLLATVVGSGIMGARLSGGNSALTLLANSLATGAGLTALILGLRSISGAHFNPLITLAEAITRKRSWMEVPAYVAAQISGAFVGVAVANGMFGEAIFSTSSQVRGGAGQFLGEFVATFGLLVIVWGCSRRDSEALPLAVGAYITAAYWFTSSTSFANPAVTLARSATGSFTGIRLADAGAFVVAQVLGAAAAMAFSTRLLRRAQPRLLQSSLRTGRTGAAKDDGDAQA